MPRLRKRAILLGVMVGLIVELGFVVAFKLDGISPFHHTSKYWFIPLLLGPSIGWMTVINASKPTAAQAPKDPDRSLGYCEDQNERIKRVG